MASRCYQKPSYPNPSFFKTKNKKLVATVWPCSGVLTNINAHMRRMALLVLETHSDGAPAKVFFAFLAIHNRSGQRELTMPFARMFW